MMSKGVPQAERLPEELREQTSVSGVFYHGSIMLFLLLIVALFLLVRGRAESMHATAASVQTQPTASDK